MRVADIMTETVIVAAPEMTISQAARLMVRQAISGLPVVDHGRLVGLITALDLIAGPRDLESPTLFALLGGYVALATSEVETEIGDILATTVAELMTTTVYSIRTDATVEELATLMYERGVNPVPVLNGAGRLVGIVSRADLLALMTGEGD